jgi:glucosamine--fructose-6-phosphate aminotransferase (isomerizing)
MCGIFGYIGSRVVGGDVVFGGLKDLEYRGYDSWGVALKLCQRSGVGGEKAMNGGEDRGRNKSKSELFVEKRVGKIGDAQLPRLETKMGIGHTRWATHGGVNVQNAHPHMTKDQGVVVVHNGIVENYEELRSQLKSEGYEFVTETDTETVAYLVERYWKQGEREVEAVRKAFLALEGLNAIIVFFVESERFVAVKNGSPLVLGKNAEGVYLASDASALVQYTQEVYFAKDQEMLVVEKEGVSLLDLEGVEQKMEMTVLNYDAKSVSLGGFEHYMMKEISEQPEVLRKILRRGRGEFAELAALVEKSYGTYFIGCGTGYYACLTATYLFSKRARRHVNTSFASEFGYLLDFVTEKSLVIALSQSGETIDILSTLQDVKEKGATIASLVNVEGSSLDRMSESVVHLQAGPEKCVLATKSFLAKLAIIYLVTGVLAKNFEESVKELEGAVAEIERLLPRVEVWRNLAEELLGHEHLYVMGRGTSYPAAMESALKIKEVSYIHAEGFAGGELKHGSIALIEQGTPVLIYAPLDETYEDMISAAHEVQARGAHVIGVSSKKMEVFDTFVEVADCGDATIMPNVVVAQLIGYYMAVTKGLDPDKPRNLAKSVTVK